jgi:SAM-dependent methyltransferase
MTEFDQYSGNYKKTVESALPRFAPPLEFYARQKAAFLRLEIGKLQVTREAFNLLNFGCGTGLVDGFLKDRKYKITGVDPSEGSLAIARLANPENHYVVIPEDKLPDLGKRFDIIYASCVFHHIPQQRHGSILFQLRCHLNQGGRLIIFEHNPYNPLTRHITQRCKLDQNARLIDASSLEEQAMKSGFRILEKKYYLFLPWGHRMWLWAEKTLLKNVPIGCQYLIVVEKI